jgi:hypothetical protein
VIAMPSNITLERPAGSHSLAAAAQRARYADGLLGTGWLLR